MRKVIPLTERFWSQVDMTGDHWLWLGAKRESGYGVLQRGRRGEGLVLAHRLSYELTYGPIPPGVFICHRCDIPACVRPTCLFPGTAKDNSLDMATKGRSYGQKRTHCPQGHPYDEANTYRTTGGRRRCRACLKTQKRQRHLDPTKSR